MVKKNNLRKVFAAFACISCVALGAAAFAACNNPEEGEEGGEAALTSGTYWAEKTTTSMGGLTYTVHITLNAEANTYYFSSYYAMDNQYAHATYVISESGTYTDDGSNIVFKTEGKADLTATVSDGSFTLDKDVAGMGMSTAELTYEKGNAPIYVTYYVDGAEYKKVGYKNSSDAVLPVEEPDEREGYTFSWGTVPATAGNGASVNGAFTADNVSEEPGEEETAEFELIGGDYNVDVTWSQMYEYNNALEYHVIINAEEKTFEVVNQAGENKGTGTVTFENGVYTLNYTNENSTTFTYDNESKTITFTSKLWINTVPFNRVDEDGETFVPYTAELTEE
ncbi:MAG: hypothetical protein K2O89_06925 [Clostridia bacterium]|nr:hypothetical protein [Clostridia bacterium]